MLKAVIFDLDGVITDTAEWHYLAWRELANRIGIDFNREFNEELKGISRMESLEKILALGGKADRYSETEKIELASTKNDHYVQLLTQMKPDAIFPGIKELLEELKANGVLIGLASASKNAPAILQSLEITNYFQTVVNPDEVERGKPAPDIFLRAAEKLAVSPAECIGIEDATAGITAIKDAGMYAVGVGTIEKMKQAGADLVVEDTQELVLSVLLREFNQ
ncbi:beta-phosphoglucomutase [Neobacillus vireti]|uniref:Beta-phosphoglucomutase n=1 Tax=Neobacillus vireti LMG 21834 TaxID=1131730 RepID=A0AB94IT08_9BACI|nr:beta-phosphoglucomutase [Neobacillus vireti]ETI70176.1 phosphatase/phosphohexomutase HAD superfamily protein [Neobacillus vireti LMG 21834]KLT16457.1 beta-phosphoglucomutase [Neobacillus vireti]